MNKRALVTGASGDIGGAIAQALAADGLDLILHANRNAEKLVALRDELNQKRTTDRQQFATCCFDVRDPVASRDALEQLLEDGPIQVVVANAGIHDDAPLAGMRVEQWQSVIDVSLNGFFNTVQPLLLPMMRTRNGRVIAISSVAGKLGNRGQANYAAAKAGLHGAIKSLALELASRGVTANTVAPGVIAGTMSTAPFSAERIRQLVPMQRAGRPEEVADLVSFLASDKAAYISGQLISVDGALS